jgi:hypothetical protein
VIEACELRSLILRLIEEAGTEQHGSGSQGRLLELAKVETLVKVGAHFQVLSQADADLVRALVHLRGSSTPA